MKGLVARFNFKDDGVLGQLWNMRYYATGLAVQKGLPIAILPLLLMVFGRDVFAIYVLYYATVQIYGTLTGLGLPLAVVPLWHSEGDSFSFIARCFRVVVAAALFAGGAVFAASLFWGEAVIGDIRAPEATLWLTAFALSYNMNLIGLGVARSEGRDLGFLLSSILGGIFLLGGIGVAWFLDFVGPRTLFLIQIMSVVASTLALFGRHAASILSARTGLHRRPLFGLLVQTRPLIANALLLLLAMSIDKWAAKAYFSRDVFNTYVIDYQAAISVFFVPTAIAIYAGPKLAAAFAKRDFAAMGHDMRIARILTLFGSLAIAVAMYIYGWLANLQLTSGYWVLIIGFLIEGQYAIGTNRVMAEQRFGLLFTSVAVGVAIYAALLFVAGTSASVYLLYWASPLYKAAMLAILAWSARTDVRPA